MEDGTEAEVLRQIRQYQRSQASKSHTGQQEETEDNFEFCWEQSQAQVAVFTSILLHM